MVDNCLREPLAQVFAQVPVAWREVTDAFIASPTGQALAAFVDARALNGALV